MREGHILLAVLIILAVGIVLGGQADAALIR